MNTLQSLHGHLSGFHFLIFLRKIGSVAQSLMLEGIKFQILGPRLTKLTIETIEQGVKYVQSLASFWYLYC